MLDYEKLFLTKSEKETMERIRYGAVLQLHIVNAQRLLDAGLISPYALSERNDEYVVTGEGLRYMEFLDQKKANAQHLEEEKRQTAKAEWCRYWITTCIALLALVVSVISLLQSSR